MEDAPETRHVPGLLLAPIGRTVPAAVPTAISGGTTAGMTCVKSRRRESGILLHPTSLPGPYGIGDLGPDSYRWIEWLASSGGTLWQILPPGPTRVGELPSPC